MTESTPNYDFTTMLEEAQGKLMRQYASMKILREHGKLILGSSSIIVSLFTLFKISSTYIKSEFVFPYILLVVVMAISYFSLMYFSIKATLPFPLVHAIDPTWDTYIQAFKDEAIRTILERRVYGYLTAIKKNESTIVNHYKISKKLNWYMTLLVFTIIVMAFLIPFIQA